MKKSLLLLVLIFFTIQCGGGKEAVNEDVILEEIASQETRADAPQSLTDTAIDSSEIIVPEPQKMAAVSQDSESVDLSQRLTVLPQFDFFFSCGDEYNIALGDSLVFVIEGDDSADVTVRLLGNDSLEKKFLFGEKKGSRLTFILSGLDVSRELGNGIHEFEAEITYDTDQPSLKLKKSIIIYDNAVDAEPVPEVAVVDKPVKIVEPKPALPDRSDPVDVQKLLSELAFDDIFFDYGVWKSPSISFNTNYIMSLGKIVKAMKADPAVNLQLTGHTDRQGSDAYNNDLAIKRASAVARLICDMFKESEREQIAERIVLRSAGKSEMLFSADNRMKEALNRRVSIQLCTNPETGISYSEYLKQLPQKAVAVKKPAPKVITKPVKKKAVTVEEQIYQKAYKLFNESNYNDAAGLFKEIINLDPKHSLADNAQWWLAEIEYSQKNYQEALLSYSKVFELGDGNKSAYARLRRGYCYFHLNLKEQARTEFQRVIVDYPKDSEEVRKAQYMLKQIN